MKSTLNLELQKKKRDYHKAEGIRIQCVLDDLSSEFSEDGIVKTVLRSRIKEEKEKSNV